MVGINKNTLIFACLILIFIISGCSDDYINQNGKQIDKKCFEKGESKGVCDAIFIGYEFDGEVCKLAYVGGCSGSMPFDDLSECINACELSNVTYLNSDAGQENEISIDCKQYSDCILVNISYGCNNLIAINKRHSLNEWERFNKQEVAWEEEMGFIYDCELPPAGIPSAVCVDKKCRVDYVEEVKN